MAGDEEAVFVVHAEHGIGVYRGLVELQLGGASGEFLRLEYEGYEPVAVVEGQKILAEAAEKFPYLHAHCVHRTGMLEIGDCAVWVGVASAHRDEAFKACRYIIDELKHRLPIWKKEHYINGDSGWVNCERCAEHAHGI